MQKIVEFMKVLEIFEFKFFYYILIRSLVSFSTLQPLAFRREKMLWFKPCKFAAHQSHSNCVFYFLTQINAHCKNANFKIAIKYFKNSIDKSRIHRSISYSITFLLIQKGCLTQTLLSSAIQELSLE